MLNFHHNLELQFNEKYTLCLTQKDQNGTTRNSDSIIDLRICLLIQFTTTNNLWYLIWLEWTNVVFLSVLNNYYTVIEKWNIGIDVCIITRLFYVQLKSEHLEPPTNNKTVLWVQIDQMCIVSECFCFKNTYSSKKFNISLSNPIWVTNSQNYLVIWSCNIIGRQIRPRFAKAIIMKIWCVPVSRRSGSTSAMILLQSSIIQAENLLCCREIGVKSGADYHFRTVTYNRS